MSSIKIFFGVWKKRLTDSEERRNYWAAEGLKIVTITVYVIISICLAFEAGLSKRDFVFSIFYFNFFFFFFFSFSFFFFLFFPFISSGTN